MTLGKIIKIVATRCQILRLKCIKFNFGWGSAPDPAGRAYSAPLDPLVALRGLLLRGGGGKGRGGEGKDRDGRGRKETPPLHAPLIHISGYAPAYTNFPSRHDITYFQQPCTKLSGGQTMSPLSVITLDPAEMLISVWHA